MIEIRTEHLRLCPLTEDDAAFVLDLLNQPSFLRWIGDRGVRSVDDAVHYIRTGPMESIRRHGFGLLRVALRSGDIPIGLCGLLKRDDLPDPDLGYALLPDYCGNGYAVEAARVVLHDARTRLGVGRVIALVTPGNRPSEKLLASLGFVHERKLVWPAGGKEKSLYALD